MEFNMTNKRDGKISTHKFQSSDFSSGLKLAKEIADQNDYILFSFWNLNFSKKYEKINGEWRLY